MWDFYEEIIKEIPEDIDSYIDFVHVGKTWTIVGAGKNFGIAVTVNEQNRIPSDYSFLYGKSCLYSQPDGISIMDFSRV